MCDKFYLKKEKRNILLGWLLDSSRATTTVEGTICFWRLPSSCSWGWQVNGVDREQMVLQNVTIQLLRSILHVEQRGHLFQILATRCKTTVYLKKNLKIKLLLNIFNFFFQNIQTLYLLLRVWMRIKPAMSDDGQTEKYSDLSRNLSNSSVKEFSDENALYETLVSMDLFL